MACFAKKAKKSEKKEEIGRHVEEVDKKEEKEKLKNHGFFKSKNRRKLKLGKFLLLLVSVIAISSGLAALFYFSYSIYEIKEFDMYLIVSDRIGFDVSQEYIHFGKVMPGGSSSKTITLIHNYKKSVRVQIKPLGEFSEWVGAEENNFILKSGENKSLSIIASVPVNATYGNYTGKLEVIFRRF